MRLAVFSDIHGNLRTWEKFRKLAVNLGVEQYAFLGDIPGMGDGEMDILADLLALPVSHWVLGNNDRSFLAHMSRQWPDHARRLLSIPQSLSATLEGTRIDMFHGSPDEPLHGRILQEDLPAFSYRGGADVVLTGHTHRRMTGTAGGVLFLNPGSLGYPRDGAPPGFAVLDLPKKEATFVDVNS